LYVEECDSEVLGDPREVMGRIQLADACAPRSSE
jgi:hypothetical protein